MTFLGTIYLATGGKRLGVKPDNNLAMLTLAPNDIAGLYLAYDKGGGWFSLQSHTGGWMALQVGQSPIAWYPVLFGARVGGYGSLFSLQFFNLAQKNIKLGVGWDSSQGQAAASKDADLRALEEGAALMVLGNENPYCACFFDVSAGWRSYGTVFEMGVVTPGLAQILATKTAAGVNFGCLGKACVDLSGAVFTGINFENTSFQGTILKGTKFTDCRLAGANFVGANLEGASFTNCPLGLNFSNAILKGTRFSTCQLAGANFSGALLEGAAFVNCPLAGLNFSGLNLQGSTFSNCTLAGTNFSGANIARADFSKSSVAGTIFTGDDLTNDVLLPAPPFSDNADLRTIFRNAKIPAAMLGRNWSFVDLTGAEIVGLDTFDLTGLVARFTVAPRLSLQGRKFQGCDFTGSDFSGSNFQDANLSSAKFFSSTLVGCLFSRGTLVQTDFNPDPATANAPASDLSGAKFSSANLTRAKMQYAKLQRSIFTSANMNEIDLTAAQLGGLDRDAAASLSWAYMANVKLDRANLFGVNLPYVTLFGASTSVTQTATMEQANFSFAYLAGIDMTGANLRGAKFNGACLVNVNLSGAELLPSASGSVITSLAGASLEGVIFSGAKLDHADLSSAAVSFARGQIPVRYCDEQHRPFPPPPDSMPLRFQETASLDLQTMGPETKCPNGFTVHENELNGKTLKEMLTSSNAPTSWFVSQCGPGLEAIDECDFI